MSTTTLFQQRALNAVAAAAKVSTERKEEVNRLNVFPVPDGDTGTNMSLTIQSVVSNVANLPIGASGADIRKAVTGASWAPAATPASPPRSCAPVARARD